MARVRPLRSPRFDPPEEPIRSEIFGVERLEQHARSLAAAQHITRGRRAGRPLLSRVEENGAVLREANGIIATAVREEHWITPAAEWLVDNFFVVEEQLRQIRHDLPVGFYNELPKLAEGPLAGYPRVYGIAWAFIAHTDSRFDPEMLRRFVAAYQTERPLMIGELWAVPITLRVTYVENLRRIAEVMVRERTLRREADAIADEILARGGRAVPSLSTMLERDRQSRLATAFAVELVQRLRDQDPAGTPALALLHERLAEQGMTPEEIVLIEHQRHASMAVTVRNIITSMRVVSALDWPVFFESVSLVDQALRAGSDFGAMDFVSRDRYRNAIEKLARRARRRELEITGEALAHARAARVAADDGADVDARRFDPGFYLVGDGRRKFERAIGFRPNLKLRILRAFVDAATPGFFGALAAFTAAILAVPLVTAALAGLSVPGLVVLGLLALIPASELAIAILYRGITVILKPGVLPRLEWADGIPEECRTMVAVPTILSGRDDVEEQIERLEVHYLANADGDIRFALVSDWADAPTEHVPGDDDILTAAREGIARLNALHGQAPGGGDRFFVFHRRRCWNESEGVWMGWERKRGKLHELNALLRGATDTTFLATADAPPVPEGVRYVVTLDSDTRLESGAVARLVGTMMHPLNRPRIDPEKKRVVEGYGVLQPRVTAPLPRRTASHFQRLSSGVTGIDPYAAAVSDVYQDLFDEGSYVGKGIYDIDAFEAVLAERVPENALLSHDLFEGLFARAGLVTDIEFFESAPRHYLAACARRHRWTRGDWQLLPWIMREPLPAIARWKMIDNLRRSLSMPAAFLTLIAGWVWPGSPPVLWAMFVVAVIAIPQFLPALAGVTSRVPGASKRRHLRAVVRDFRSAVAQTGLTLTMMAHQAWLMADAIVRTLTRLYVTHRLMLEWRPAAQAASQAPVTLGGFYRSMVWGLVLAVAGAVAVAAVGRPEAWLVALPFLALWWLAPLIARWISAPGHETREVALTRKEALTLRLIGRRTWMYFETFVASESMNLPPDNFQETPVPVVTQRTSPTNIGLYLLSAVSARDFGWIGIFGLVERLEATIRSVKGLKHHRGHLYNWYDTRDGRALEPQYVSSVDSGNLAGALLALANACEEMIDKPVPLPVALTGIEDAALLLREAAHTAADRHGAGVAEVRGLDEALSVVMSLVAQPPATPAGWATRMTELETAARAASDCAHVVAGGSESPRREVLVAADVLRNAVKTHARDLDALMPWARLSVDGATASATALVATPMSLAELPRRCQAVLHDLVERRAALANAPESATDLGEIDALVGSLERSAGSAATLVQRLVRLANDARQMVMDMDFGLLFDPTRMLFSIGYRMNDGGLDPGRYDLLASEARLMSFIAIAKGDVPVKHWFRLGRPLILAGGDAVLLSWSGSMFEYLMPALIMRAPADGLLDQSCRRVVRRQIRYGARRGVPWGVSESGYNARDLAMTYQYSNFGVPGLGLRRGLADDVVVAPYATGLAAMLDPEAALRNFRALTNEGAAGPYGFYEALDYTPSRLPENTRRAVVRMYMAHHQGMLMVALGNVLHGGAMRARFHAEPIVRASELLLEERTPRDVAVVRPHLHPATVMRDVRELVPPHTRHFETPYGATPRSQILSNGNYSVMLTVAGSGYSRWRDLAVTRWREDPTRDDAGSYIFLRDVESGECSSATFQPCAREPKSYNVSFTEDRGEFIRRDGSIETRLEVIVSSEDNAEVRRVAISNRGTRTREIEVTSYAEIVLAPAGADTSHPAFSNLFVQTESVAELNTLLASRRRRSPEDAEVWLAHVVAVEGETLGELEWETDRSRFLGRGRGVRAPQAQDGRALTGTTGPVLDPIVSLRRRVRVPAGETVWLVFSTLVGSSRSEVLNLADKYNDVTTFDRAATLAWTQAMVQLHHLGIGPDEAHLFQTLSGALLYSDRKLRAPGEARMRQIEGVTALWASGISGDLPIVLVKIDDAEDIGLVRQLLRAHRYWRMKGLAVDLVILNDRAPSYLQDLQALLETIVGATRTIAQPEGHESRGNVFILRSDQVTTGQSEALESVARVFLSSRNGPLAAQIARAGRPNAPAIVPPERTQEVPAVSPARDYAGELEFFNGLGGFSADGREYHIVLRAGQWTPAPWINVIANPRFGCLVSEAGAGCTWSINSQKNRLTPWSNDPVSDPPAEMFYIRDDESETLWSPTPLPIREDAGSYEVRHGRGWTRFAYDAHGIALDLLHFVPAGDPVKISRLTITNHSSNTRRLSVTAYLEWVLGESRGASAPYVVTEMDPVTGAMFARNPWNADFGTRIAFADLGGAQTAWTGDRTEFVGRNGTLEHPAAVSQRKPMSGRCGAGLDPCAALQTALEIPPGGRSEVTLLLGQTETREEASALIQRYRSADLTEHLNAVIEGWNDVLETVQVKTPDPALDLMLNGQLLYQTIASRLWARAAFYQSSGAYGFRDQLQDVTALAVSNRDLAREHLLRSAARQFADGDVQHWWHEPAGRGVRTRMSDDLLWLPYVAGHYLEVTGDRAVLDEVIPFLDGPPLEEGQLEAYFAAQASKESGTLFEHCARAIDRSLSVGAHGLPLIGTGDWNDGMNRVGHGGTGESVWLAWFLCSLLAQWAPLAQARRESRRAKDWKRAATALRDAAERAWDGEWYRRAYFDDGTPLGSAANDECAIDSIAQSWAVISAAADPDHARRAMASVYQRLVRHDDGLILLLAPPFEHTSLEPGYIKGYVPGVRENGGQYTHAAAWVAIAFAILGDGNKVGELLSMVNPIMHGATPGGVRRYRVEPYVVAGDVYSGEPHAGRGGWTWYTGSAAWLYRAGLEWMLGFRLRGTRLELDPCVPTEWMGFTITFRYRSSRYDIEVENRGAGRGVSTLELDRVALSDRDGIPLEDDGRAHHVRVVLG